jgi:quercetin dioxygenase-like cupin family protein
MSVAAGELRPTRASSTTFLMPAVAPVLGVIVRSERVALLSVAGSVVCVSGALLMQRAENSQENRKMQTTRNHSWRLAHEFVQVLGGLWSHSLHWFSDKVCCPEPGQQARFSERFKGEVPCITSPHSYPCPVIGYDAQGTLRTQVKGEPEMTYKAGESFYEAPNGVHLVSANASSTEPVKLLAYFVCDREGPLSIPKSAKEESETSMAISFDLKSPMDAVYSASGAAILLALKRIPTRRGSESSLKGGNGYATKQTIACDYRGPLWHCAERPQAV